jgi:hypothetical protein
MKLLRYGPAGQEKPGLLDRDGKIRDLSGAVRDIDGETLSPASLDRLRRLDPSTLPLVPETRLEARRDWPQLPGACRGDRGGDPQRTDLLYEGDDLDLRAG